MINFLRDIISGAVVLGILVLLHEWGHFVAAKLCGVRVDVFSIGFGPRLFGTKRGDTDYRVSAFPLGGYVRMAGDNPVEERTGADYEFLSRPRWQRFLIAVAGPIVNISFAFLIFWGIYAAVGMPYDTSLRQPADVVAVPVDSVAASGIQPGDRILQVNGVPTPNWEKVLSEVDDPKPGTSYKLSISRNGAPETLNVSVPANATPYDLVGYPSMPAVVDEVGDGTPASKGGIKPGDRIVAMNGTPVVTWLQLLGQVRSSGGRPIEFIVERDGNRISLVIAPAQAPTPDGQTTFQIGITEKSPEAYERQGIITSIKDAGAETYMYGHLIIGLVGGLLTGKFSMHDLAGPVGIVKISGEAAKRGPVTLFQWMAYISLDLGLLNLLPIPILDGGHVLMLAIEGLIRRDLSISVKERFVQVGLVFLLGLFAFVMYSDILKLVQSR
jgi:regulator of sigma E protease